MDDTKNQVIEETTEAVVPESTEEVTQDSSEDGTQEPSLDSAENSSESDDQETLQEDTTSIEETAETPTKPKVETEMVVTSDGEVIEVPVVNTTLDFSDSFSTHWYVVHTYSGHEKKVANALRQRIASMRLQDKIFDILIPTQEKIEVRRGKKEQIKEKIFPGYILVKMIVDDYSWLAVRTTPGVTGFVGAGNKPTPIPEQEVQAIQKFMTMDAPKYKAVFSPNEPVKIIDGPFSEFLGTVESIDEARGKIKVLVSIFGRETPVELDFLQVSKL